MVPAEPDLSNLTPYQRFRWHVSADAHTDSLTVDTSTLPPDVALAFERLQGSLADMLKLMTEHHGEMA